MCYYPSDEDPHEPDTIPTRQRMNPWGADRLARCRFGLVCGLLPCQGNMARIPPIDGGALMRTKLQPSPSSRKRATDSASSPSTPRGGRAEFVMERSEIWTRWIVRDSSLNTTEPRGEGDGHSPRRARRPTRRGRAGALAAARCSGRGEGLGPWRRGLSSGPSFLRPGSGSGEADRADRPSPSRPRRSSPHGPGAGERLFACKLSYSSPQPPNYSPLLYLSGCIRFAMSEMHLRRNEGLISPQVMMGLCIKTSRRKSNLRVRQPFPVQDEDDRGVGKGPKTGRHRPR